MTDTRARVAAAQLGPSGADRQDTIRRIVKLLETANERGVSFVCFPELALGPYFCTQVLDEGDVATYFSECPPTPETKVIFSVAREAGIAFVLPFAEQADGRRYNSALVVERTGEPLGVYRKVHIPGRREPLGELPQNLERRYFDDGDLGFPVFQTHVGRVGVLICADRSFPESWRVLGIQSADIVCTPYNTSVLVPNWTQTADGQGDPITELRRVKTLHMTASASFNQYFVIGAGKAGVEGGVSYVGGSCVISPWGQVMAATDETGDCVVDVDIDPELPARMRSKSRYLQRRRVEHYQELVADVMGEDER